MRQNRHCEERSDEAIHLGVIEGPTVGQQRRGLLRFARNDEQKRWFTCD
jgi:hypothetical protein